MGKRDRNREKREKREEMAASRRLAAEALLRSGELPPGFILPGMENERRCTGPKTPEGKAVSSANAVTHGVTSKRLFLQGENEEEFADLWAGWMLQYPPESPAEVAMVEQLAKCEWFARRAERRYLEVEERLQAKHAGDWEEEEFRRLERILRYKTTAERAFQRALAVVRQLRKDRLQEAREEERAEAAEEKASEKAAGKRVVYEGTGKNRKPVFCVLEQWMEIRVTDGVTTTEYIPTNAELRKMGAESAAVPQMVYRRMNFPDGVPVEEYGWTNVHDMEACELKAQGKWCEGCARFLHGGHGIQRMTYETWLEISEQEEAREGGHAGPTGVGNLPRPKERGGEVAFAEMLGWLGKKEERLDC